VGLGALPALVQATLIHFGKVPLFGGFMAAPLLDPSMGAQTREIIEEVTRRANALHPRYGKLVEIGALYTTIAGLLNILAIYDALDGPAHPETDPEPTPEAAAAPVSGPVASQPTA
jgi:hypothetical protein